MGRIKKSNNPQDAMEPLLPPAEGQLPLIIQSNHTSACVLAEGMHNESKRELHKKVRVIS